MCILLVLWNPAQTKLINYGVKRQKIHDTTHEMPLKVTCLSNSWPLYSGHSTEIVESG